MAGPSLIGRSPAWLSARRRLERAAKAPSTVLLCGESGTGKELAARLLHSLSPRAHQTFVAVNCAVLTSELAASELFGHERGAFTGALSRRLGAFEEAHQGTLFLDEVAELGIGLQAKLLRALQEREIVRLGSSRSLDVDVRVIAATHRDLARAAESGTFRNDLYHRLNVIEITLPPLRERPEDIQLLADHFVDQLGHRLGLARATLSREARACLARYDWPGNVRELSNTIERALVLGDGETILADDLPRSLLESYRPVESGLDSLAPYHRALRNLKVKVIMEAVIAADGNITRAAQALGLNVNYLHRLITNLDLRPRLAGILTDP